jgi:hypothetical protein
VIVWILIFSMFAGSNNGMVEVSAPIFHSQASCVAAGNAWLKQIAATEQPWRKNFALCVQDR